jgi:putative ABC transport system permease protein
VLRFLAAIGVYGVLAYAVTRRTREIGIRTALGASRGRLFRRVVRDGMRPVAAGAIAGLAGAVAASGLLRSLLFGVTTTDPFVFVLSGAVVVAAALAACVVPAVRAIRVDPIVSLRDQ